MKFLNASPARFTLMTLGSGAGMTQDASSGRPQESEGGAKTVLDVTSAPFWFPHGVACGSGCGA